MSRKVELSMNCTILFSRIEVEHWNLWDCRLITWMNNQWCLCSEIREFTIVYCRLRRTVDEQSLLHSRIIGYLCWDRILGRYKCSISRGFGFPLCFRLEYHGPSWNPYGDFEKIGKCPTLLIGRCSNVSLSSCSYLQGHRTWKLSITFWMNVLMWRTHQINEC